jgi:hypothetical protein
MGLATAGPTSAKATEGTWMEEPGYDIRSDLIDLTDVDLGDLQAAILRQGWHNDSALSQSLRRVIRGADHPTEAVARFNSCVSSTSGDNT